MKSYLTKAGTALRGRPLTAKSPNPGVPACRQAPNRVGTGQAGTGTPLRSLNSAAHHLSFLPRITVRDKLQQESRSFSNHNNWILVFTRMIQPKDQRRSGGILTNHLLKNPKGVSVLFLIVALLLMVMAAYVLSYLIPTKQKSVKFPIYSTQAFYLAQSGVEYGVYYCSNQGWRGATDSGRLDYDRLNDIGAKNLVIGKENGKFTIDYDTGTGVLTSTGEVNQSTEKRIVTVSNFNQFLRLTFTSSPCWISGYSNTRAQFEIRRWRSTTVTLNAFSATWQEDTVPARNITTIRFGNQTRFSGTYNNGSGIVSFSAGQSVGTNGETVRIWWDAAMTNPRNIIITFYTSATPTLGEGYTFNLDPAGNNLPNC